MSKKPTYEELKSSVKMIYVGTERHLWIGVVKFLFILSMVWIHSGCIPKVNIPAVDHFKIKTNMRSGIVDISIYKEQLLSDLYILMKANEGIEVPICESSKELKQC